MSVPASSLDGNEDHYGYPPPPVPNIKLELDCVGFCFEKPIENPAAACSSLVSQNLRELSGKYEVSVPTSDLKCALDETDGSLGSIIDAKYYNPFENFGEFLATKGKIYHLGDNEPRRIIESRLASLAR
jgi:hypothetical protein